MIDQQPGNKSNIDHFLTHLDKFNIKQKCFKSINFKLEKDLKHQKAQLRESRLNKETHFKDI